MTSATLEQGFVMMPYQILTCGDALASTVWAMIRKRITIPSWRFNCQFFANELGLCVTTVQRKINWLVKQGLLKKEVKRNRGRFWTEYEIPEELLCLNDESLEAYKKARKVEVKKFEDTHNSYDLNCYDSSASYINIESTEKEIKKRERNKEVTHSQDFVNTNIEDISQEIKIEKPILKSEITLTNKNLNEDKYSEGVAQKSQFGIIKGEWLDEDGFFKTGFVEWRAKYALKTFADIETMESAINWAEKNFYNHQDQLPLMWRQYQRAFDMRAENITTRVQRGCEIKESEKELIIKMGVEQGRFEPQDVLPEAKPQPQPIVALPQEVKEDTPAVATDVLEKVEVMEFDEEDIWDEIEEELRQEEEELIESFTSEVEEAKEQSSRLKSVSTVINEIKGVEMSESEDYSKEPAFNPYNLFRLEKSKEYFFVKKYNKIEGFMPFPEWVEEQIKTFFKHWLVATRSVEKWEMWKKWAMNNPTEASKYGEGWKNA